MTDLQIQRTIRTLLGVLFFAFYTLTGHAQNKGKKINVEGTHIISVAQTSSLRISSPDSRIRTWALQKVIEKPDRNHKLNAILLAVALGPFGVHRLYLGTHPRVPVIYTLTLGGGLGILPLTDIIAIIATKDIEKFINNDKVIMWAN